MHSRELEPSLTPQNRTSLFLHTTLALLAPFVTGLLFTLGHLGVPDGLLQGMVAVVAAVYGSAPLLGYLSLLMAPEAVPSVGHCTDSGQFLGVYWVELEQHPGHRFWTTDGARVERLRSHPANIDVEPGFERTFRPRAATRPKQHLDAAATTLKHTLGGITLGFLTTGALTVLLTTPGRPLLDHVQALFALAFVTFWVAYLPALICFLVVFGAGFLLAHATWNRGLRPRRTQRVALTRTLLDVDGTRLALDDPDLTQTLTHDAFGARLTIRTRTQTIQLNGDHATLLRLHRTLLRVRPTPDGPRRVPTPLLQLTDAARLTAETERRRRTGTGAASRRTMEAHTRLAPAR